jgi:hypothetical protein
MRTALPIAVKTAVTGTLFYLLFRRVDLAEFAATLRHARYDILALSFLILWIGHLLCVFRWRMLMRPVMPAPSALNLLGIYCIGLFFNLAFPTVVGGDVVKMYYAGKPSRRFAQSFAATFLDRDAGMLAMMVIAVIASIAHPVRLAGVPVLTIIYSAFAAFVVANFAIFAPGLHRLFVDGLRRFGLGRLAGKLDTLSGVLQAIGKYPGMLALSLGISLVNQLLVISVTWLVAVGLHIRVAIPYFLVFVPTITLISMIPVSLNGMGLREYAFAALFSGVGVDRESSVALGLISSAIIVLSAIPGGVIYIFFRNRADRERMVKVETDLS